MVQEHEDERGKNSSKKEETGSVRGGSDAQFKWGDQQQHLKRRGKREFRHAAKTIVYRKT